MINLKADLESLKIRAIEYLKDGDSVRLGRRDLRVLHTPGHTDGSVCLHDNELVLTGDTVFPGGCLGRTDLPSEIGESSSNYLIDYPILRSELCCQDTASHSSPTHLLTPD